ncbi:GNAT family N-acetyltransferase [bacterium]|nr:MAG: GNAT family N-acetyltransferase [bacterium]
MQIYEDDPRKPEVSRLLNEHLDAMRSISPPESKHALDVDGLCVSEISFWTARDADQVFGCGALFELDSTHGEIKSMRTARAHLRKGVASMLLKHIIEAARSRGFVRLSLETGSMEEFAPARAMYARFGFVECEPFGAYQADPNSVFMMLEL